MSGGGKALVLTFLIILGTITLALYAVEQKGALHVEFPDPLQLTSLAITAAALVVTGVGVFVALLAFIGYREILTKVESAAREEAARVARETAEPLAARYVVAYLDDLRERAAKSGHAGEKGTAGLDPLTSAFIRPTESGEGDDAGGSR